MISAMKAKEELRVQTLRGAMAAFTNELVAKGMKPTEPLDDQGALAVLKRLAKQRREAAEQYEKGGRSDLADKEKAELVIIEAYLPAQMSREDVVRIAQKMKADLNVTDTSGAGKLTGAIMKELAGQADGALVKEVVAGLFS